MEIFLQEFEFVLRAISFLLSEAEYQSTSRIDDIESAGIEKFKPFMKMGLKTKCREEISLPIEYTLTERNIVLSAKVN
jgi:hypothetical protein